MHRAISAVLTCAAVVLAAAAAPTAQTGPATVLYQNRVVELERTLPDPNDLWVLPQDLPRVNDFELKPEGACLAELCVPVRQDRDSEHVRHARAPGLVQRHRARPAPAAGVRGRSRVSRLELRQHSRHAQRFLQSAMAPDFALPNREGKLVRLSDFEGKKVLIVTWASW